jgi:hypothetical protein
MLAAIGEGPLETHGVAIDYLPRNVRPSLRELQDQQFKEMSADYKKHFLKEVPLSKFSENLYESMLRGEMQLPTDGFFDLIQEMTAHKMALEQHDVDNRKNPITRWVFRHDKVRDYFLMHAFLPIRNTFLCIWTTLAFVGCILC